MEMTLEVVSFQKSLMGEGRVHTFGPSGGSIGRARDNSWVLPDPNRYVSSRHAEIACRDGRFRIIDTSTNGVFVNDSATALGRDGETDLSDGDRLMIGDYEIAVRVPEQSAARPDAARPTPVSRPDAEQRGASPMFERPPPKDILDVVDRRRSEPRLGPLTIPDDPLDDEPAPAKAPPPADRAAPEPQRGTAAPSQPPIPPPSVPPPPRPSTKPAQGGSSVPPMIPDDADLAPASRAGPPAATPRPMPPSPPPVPPRLPDDLDDLLPGPPESEPPRPAPPMTLPADAVPEIPGAESHGADAASERPVESPVPRQAAPEQPAPPAPEPEREEPARDEPAPADILPPGVPLLRPVPGTGNRQEPLSPSAAAPTAPVPAPPAPAASAPASPALDSPAAEPAAAVPPAPPSPAAAAPAAAPEALLDALAEGLGLDRGAVDGLDAAATIALVARAARAAALGIGDAFDARNALARAAGVDLRARDQDDSNPFLTYRSGEAALKQAIKGGGADSLALDEATRSSVVALTASSLAATAAFDALFDRFAAGTPPGSADELREFFGTALANAYHRETRRLS